MGSAENPVQAACMEWFERQGIKPHRISNRMFKGGKYNNKTLIGFSDIFCVMPPNHRLVTRALGAELVTAIPIFTETKRPKGGVQRDKQKEFEADKIKNKCIYILANDVTVLEPEIIRQLKEMIRG